MWVYSQDKGRPITGQLTTVEGGGAICSGSSGSSRAAAASAAPALRAETVFKSAVQNLWESPQSAGNTWRPCSSLAKHEGTGVSPSERAVCYLTAENRTCPVGACAQHGRESKQTAGAAQTRAFAPCAGATAASRRWKGRWKRSRGAEPRAPAGCWRGSALQPCFALSGGAGARRRRPPEALPGSRCCTCGLRTSKAGAFGLVIYLP